MIAYDRFPADDRGTRFGARPADRAETSRRLVEVTDRLTGTLSGVATALADANPESPRALASIVSTLAAVVRATEVSSARVLEELDGLERDRDDLRAVLEDLDAADQPGPEAAGSVKALTAAVDLQNVTARHLTSAARSVRDARDGLDRVLGALALCLEGGRVGWRPGAAAPAWRLAVGEDLLERLASDPG
jgi:hypothetical protein